MPVRPRPSPARSISSIAALSLSVPEANELLLGVGIALNKTEFDNVFDHFPGAREGELDAISFSEALAAPVSTGAEPRFFNSKGVAIPQGQQARMTFSGPGCTPNSKHLGLSGISHADFGTQRKPFPAHWGAPPNVAMKGQHGIVRDLPSGYGKGNGLLEKWVLEHLEQAMALSCLTYYAPTLYTKSYVETSTKSLLAHGTTLLVFMSCLFSSPKPREQDAKSSTDEFGRKPYPYGNYSLGSAAENPAPKLHMLTQRG